MQFLWVPPPFRDCIMRIGTVNINFSGFFARIKLCFASGGRDSKGSGLPHDVYTMNVFANSGDDFGPSPCQKWWIVDLDTQVLTRFTCWGSRGRHTKIFWYSRKYIRNIITDSMFRFLKRIHVGETVSINGWSSLRYISFASLPLYLIPFSSWPSLKPYHPFSPPRNRV